jgi:hypothetical protein
MSETIANDTPITNDTSTQTTSRPPMERAPSLPGTPTSPLTTNPWYQKKFELVCRILNELKNIMFVFSIAM